MYVVENIKLFSVNCFMYVYVLLCVLCVVIVFVRSMNDVLVIDVVEVMWFVVCMIVCLLGVYDIVD